MTRQAYDSDLADDEWELFEKTLLAIRKSTKGRKSAAPADPGASTNRYSLVKPEKSLI